MPRAPLAFALLAACSAPAAGTASDASSSSGPVTTGAPTTSGASTGALPEPSTVTTDASVTTVTTDASTDASGTTGEPAPGLRYHEVRQKSAHNAFQRHEALIDQLVHHRIRSLELDIHRSAAFAPALDGDWYVYHIDVVDDDTHCRRLSQCLGQVAAFQRALPEHEVVTLWIDLKDDFAGAHEPDDLDALLLAAFGDRLLTPAALRAACPAATSLQEAVGLPGCAWPELAALRGRVVVALTGGDLDGGALATYAGDDAGARAAFVAPGLTAVADLPKHGDAIVHNLAFADVGLAAAVRDAGMIARVWVADDADAWAQAEAAFVHHIATNKIHADVDPWATTAGPGGWPFRCLADCDAPTREAGALLAVTVDSGDLWSDSDDALLLARELPGDVVLTALVAAPSSHVEPWAKACLTAREGLAADAAYLAICRPADDHAPRVQLRAAAGADTEAIDMDAPGGLSGETPAFLRLERTGACARGLASADGLTWLPVAEHCFAAAPAHVGLVAASHAAGPLRLLVADLRATPGGPLAAADLSATPLGGAAGAAADL